MSAANMGSQAPQLEEWKRITGEKFTDCATRALASMSALAAVIILDNILILEGTDVTHRRRLCQLI